MDPEFFAGEKKNSQFIITSLATTSAIALGQESDTVVGELPPSLLAKLVSGYCTIFFTRKLHGHCYEER